MTITLKETVEQKIIQMLIRDNLDPDLAQQITSEIMNEMTAEELETVDFDTLI